MENELEELSTTILKMYNKNLTFIKKEFPVVFEEVEELSLSIENETYKEKYTLEYRNGYFDILNQEVNGWYYGTNSFEDADARTLVANKTTENSLELLRKNPRTNKLLNSDLYKDVAPIIDHINDVVDTEKLEFEKIFKMIYIGTGLGFHIHQIDKKLSSFTTLIIEEELEIFRLSLFMTDYTVFEEGNRKLFLSIGTKENTLNNALNEFYLHHKYMNYSIKYNTLLSDNGHIKDEIIQYFAMNSSVSFPYKIILQNLERLIGFINNGERFLNLPVMRKELILKDKKVLMIAAGPSLDNYIEWIQEHQNKFTIVAVDVIVKKLEIYNIVPDIVVSIDPLNLVAEFLDTENVDFLKNTAILFLSQQSSKVMDVVKDKNYYFSQVLPLINEIEFMGSTPNVGTYSLELAIYLGAENLYTIGNDAAFNQETGERYSSDAAIQRKLNKTVTLKDDKSGIHKTDVMEIKGNLRDIIKTNRTLFAVKSNFEAAVRHFNNIGLEFNIYNLSDGAFIEGMIPTSIDEMNECINDDINYNDNIIEKMDSVSKVIIDLDFNDDIKALTTIITRINKFKKIKMKDKDHFLQNKLDTMIWILEKIKTMSIGLYSVLFLEFTGLIDIYINYLLNLKQKNIHEKDELNKISKLWAIGAELMFKEIKKELNKLSINKEIANS